MIVRRPVGVRMLVHVLLVWVIVFVVTVIVTMTVLRAVRMGMRMRVFVALHDGAKFKFSSSASRRCQPIEGLLLRPRRPVAALAAGISRPLSMAKPAFDAPRPHASPADPGGTKV